MKILSKHIILTVIFSLLTMWKGICPLSGFVGEFENTFSPRTFNQREVSKQMQSLIFLDFDESDLLLPLDQLTAQQYTTIIPSAELANQRFQRDLYQSIRDLATSCIGCNCYFGDCEQWITGAYEKTNVHGSRNARGFRSEGYDISFGAHTRLTPFWTVGGAGFYEHDFFHYNVGGTGRSNTGLGAIYTLYRPCDYYFFADVTFGARDHRVSRLTGN